MQSRSWCKRDNAAERLALPAGGWDEATPFYRNPLQARNLPKNAQTPTRRVHAVLGCFLGTLMGWVWEFQ